MQKVFWTQGAKVSEKSFAPPKPHFAPVQKQFWVVQKTFRRPLLPGSKRPFAPSPKHFWEFSLFGQFPRPAGPYLALSRFRAQLGVLNRLVLNHLGGSTARWWRYSVSNPLRTSAKEKRDRGHDSQPRPRPRLNSQPQGATKDIVFKKDKPEEVAPAQPAGPNGPQWTASGQNSARINLVSIVRVAPLQNEIARNAL